MKLTLETLALYEKAYEDMEELRYYLECDDMSEVVDAVKKCMEDYENCADQLHILRDQINMMERRAA